MRASFHRPRSTTASSPGGIGTARGSRWHVPWSLAALLVLPLPALATSTTFTFNVPLGFPTPKVPSDNPMSVEKVELGRLLFYDVRLSGNLMQSCASCHQQELGFTDGLERSVGSTGEVHPRNAMSLTNVAYAPTLTWASPILRDLENQAMVPMFGTEPVELGLEGREDELFARLQADGRYRRMFAEAYPEDDERITLANIVRAIGSFQRTLLSGNAPYDRFILGLDDDALSESAIRGGNLYFGERFECFHCHGGFNLSSSVTFEGQVFEEILFENNGLYNIDGMGGYPVPNRGLFDHTHVIEDMGRFKPPTLRNIEVTAPYMHDGTITTLEAAIDHYAAAGRTIPEGEPNAGDGSQNPFKNKLFIRGFTMTPQEKLDIIEFLKGLTDREFLANPRFSNPFDIACPGDCDYSSDITVDEIVISVNVAVGAASLAACVSLDENSDGEVDVAEIIGMVTRALGGCSGEVAALPAH